MVPNCVRLCKVTPRQNVSFFVVQFIVYIEGIRKQIIQTHENKIAYAIGNSLQKKNGKNEEKHRKRAHSKIENDMGDSRTPKFVSGE